MRLLRIAFLVAAVGLLVYGLLWERHEVGHLDASAPVEMTGPGFTQTATFDGLMRRGDRLYFVRDPGTAKAVQDDCPT